jgi:hypothetical protein
MWPVLLHRKLLHFSAKRVINCVPGLPSHYGR